MERMTMRTVGEVVDTTAARLRALAASVWPASAHTAPCPAYACVPSASNPSIGGRIMTGNAKSATGGFGLTDHVTRRHPERSP